MLINCTYNINKILKIKIIKNSKNLKNKILNISIVFNNGNSILDRKIKQRKKYVF